MAPLGTVMQILTVALFTFYMTAYCCDAPGAALDAARGPPARGARAIEVAIDRTGGYFYSLVLLAGISASVAWAAFTIIGVPYPLALALWMGLISQFVPVLGTYIGGILPLAVALIESPYRGLAVFGYVLVYQGIENYLLAPRITARTMSLHRWWPSAAFAGGGLLGGAGGADGAAGGSHSPGARRGLPAPSRGGRTAADVGYEGRGGGGGGGGGGG